jgi:hypothetical protein
VFALTKDDYLRNRSAFVLQFESFVVGSVLSQGGAISYAVDVAQYVVSTKKCVIKRNFGVCEFRNSLCTLFLTEIQTGTVEEGHSMTEPLRVSRIFLN